MTPWLLPRNSLTLQIFRYYAFAKLHKTTRSWGASGKYHNLIKIRLLYCIVWIWWHPVEGHLKLTFQTVHGTKHKMTFDVTDVTLCKHYIALFGSDDILLRVISDWPFREPMESLLPIFGPVVHDSKRKMMLDVMDVTLCKYSATLAPFLAHLSRRLSGELIG